MLWKSISLQNKIRKIDFLLDFLKKFKFWFSNFQSCLKIRIGFQVNWYKMHVQATVQYWNCTLAIRLRSRYHRLVRNTRISYGTVLSCTLLAIRLRSWDHQLVQNTRTRYGTVLKLYSTRDKIAQSRSSILCNLIARHFLSESILSRVDCTVHWATSYRRLT